MQEGDGGVLTIRKKGEDGNLEDSLGLCPLGFAAVDEHVWLVLVRRELDLGQDLET